MNDQDIIKYYSTHGVRATTKNLGISYNQLKEACARCHFTKSKEQIKESYKTTRIEKYGSIEGYRKAKWDALKKTKEASNLMSWIDEYNLKKEAMENDK